MVTKIFLHIGKNQMYRPWTNLDRYYAECIFDNETIINKECPISKEAISEFLNSKIP